MSEIIDSNKKAYFEYFILETIEAGIALKGTEVKSVKLRHVNIGDSFCFIERGELFLKNCHIAPYEKGSFFNTEERRDRKLLLHRREIDRLAGKIGEKGLTIVPLKMYFKNGRVKLEIGLVKGKKIYDKRESIKEKDVKRDLERQIKNYK